jgi:dihydrofolate reductase
MRKIIESTFVTLDSVISDPQIWSPPYWDDQHNAYASKLLFDVDALLVGRKTYEGFAEAWPARGGDPYTDRINAIPKYMPTGADPAEQPGTAPRSRQRWCASPSTDEFPRRFPSKWS